MGIGRKLLLYKSTLITIFTPLLLSPLLFTASPGYYEEAACGFSILLMAVYWITEVVPLAVTALLPLVLYPLLGILKASVVCLQYFKDVNVLFFGGLTVAVAIEHWNLHKRVALKVLTLVGSKPKWLMFGFMVTTAFLSMWISNVATTAMMVPIAQAVLDEMKNDKEDSESVSSSEPPTPPIKTPDITVSRPIDTIITVEENDEHPVVYKAITQSFANGYMGHEPNGNIKQADIELNSLSVPSPELGPDASSEELISPKQRKMEDADQKINTINQHDKSHVGLCKALTICICYSANIGGTATLTGTGPNLIMAGQFRTKYPSAPEVDFGSWMIFAILGMFAFLIICWFWLQYLFLDTGVDGPKDIQARAAIRKQYEALGPITFAETVVLTMFVIMAVLWLTRDPGFIPGWSSLPIFKNKYITDATVSMTICFLLFILPSKMPNFLSRHKAPVREDIAITGYRHGPVPPILTWKVLNTKMAWNVILLLGGGFAMALGAQTSGLSDLIGHTLEPFLRDLPPIAAAVICCFVIALLTQCTSNTATATVFIPILAELGEILHINPLYLMLPATITTSYAFMFPVSTPPNAIAYSYGHLKMIDMMKAGVLLNFVGLLVVILTVYTMGSISFDVFTNCPDWLNTSYCYNLTSSITTFSNSTAVL